MKYFQLNMSPSGIKQNDGPGVQHIALKTDDIFFTLRNMRQVRINVSSRNAPQLYWVPIIYVEIAYN